MSTATVFKPGGHFHDTGDRFIDRLPRGLHNAATRPDVQATSLAPLPTLHRPLTPGEISVYRLKRRGPGAQRHAALNRLVESGQVVAGDHLKRGRQPLRTVPVSSLAQSAGGDR
jgi:hypothetical protein